ncbi:MAG: hypothetical protein U0V70_21335 [Terriglobia bacterium]
MTLNRREFAQGLSALAIGTGLMSLPRRAMSRTFFPSGKASSLWESVPIPRKFSLEAMIERLHELEITDIELSHPQTMLPNKVKVEDVKPLTQLFKDGKIRVRSWYCAGVRTPDELRKVVEIAKVLGVRHVSGDATGESLKAIDRAFQREGLYFGLPSLLQRQQVRISKS